MNARGVPRFAMSRAAAHETPRALGRTLTIWLAYVTAVTLLASVTKQIGGPPQVPPSLLHGFIDNLAGAPPLARWDSIWFYGIAAEGYSGQGPDSRYTAGFLPLYPFLMRCIAAATGLGYFTAGLWISRIALLGALVLLPVAVNDCQDGSPVSAAAVQLSLLAFPTAFLLAAVYVESLFLCLTLAAFVLARRGYFVWAAAAAFLAALTRLHGLALIPAFIALALTNRRGDRRSAWTLAPALGELCAYVGLAFYFWRRFGDPFRYLAAKREGWGTRLATPWQSLDHALLQLEQALNQPQLGTLLRAMEIPCLFLIVLAIAHCCRRATAPEALYCAFGLALSLVSGSLWGLPRFTLVLFPAFAVLASLQRRRLGWYAYLLAGGIVQTCLLINYVNFGGPAP